MKNFRFVAMAGFIACCMFVLGSQADTFGQGRSDRNRRDSRMERTQNGGSIQRRIERITGNRTQRGRNNDWNRNDYRRNRSRRYYTRSNNGVRDYGRGIGRGNGQGKGRGYYNNNRRRRNN